MKNTSYYIDEIKRVQGITSDYAVAKLLGVQRNMMTHYKNGRSSFDGDMVFRVAELSRFRAGKILQLEGILSMRRADNSPPSMKYRTCGYIGRLKNTTTARTTSSNN